MGGAGKFPDTDACENANTATVGHLREKRESKVTQLERRFVDGTISMAKSRIRRSVQSDLEKIWSDRMEKEDKIMLIKYETLNSTVERLGCEIKNLKEKKMGSAASTMAASSGSGGSTNNTAATFLSGVFSPSRVELKG